MRLMYEETLTPQPLHSVEELLHIFARGIRRRLTNIFSGYPSPASLAQPSRSYSATRDGLP